MEDGETITLRNGDMVFGPNAANEYCEYVFGARLNEYGEKLFGYVDSLQKIGLLELHDKEVDGRTFLSIAPWHNRLV